MLIGRHLQDAEDEEEEDEEEEEEEDQEVDAVAPPRAAMHHDKARPVSALHAQHHPIHNP